MKFEIWFTLISGTGKEHIFAAFFTQVEVLGLLMKLLIGSDLVLVLIDNMTTHPSEQKSKGSMWDRMCFGDVDIRKGGKSCSGRRVWR